MAEFKAMQNWFLLVPPSLLRGLGVPEVRGGRGVQWVQRGRQVHARRENPAEREKTGSVRMAKLTSEL